MTTRTLIFVLLVASIFFNIVPAVSSASISNDECLGWYNHNRVDFLVREGVLPGTILTCDQDELDRLNQLAAINEHEGEAITPQPDSDDDDDDDEDRKDIRYCANSGYWNGQKCIINDEVEKAAYEDAVCDNPKDTQKYTKVCGGSSSLIKEDNTPKKTENTITVQPPSNVQQKEFDFSAYVENQKRQDLLDDDPTTAEYKEKLTKIVSEMSPEEKERSAEPAENIAIPLPPSSSNDNDDNNDTPRISSEEASEQEEEAMNETSNDAADKDPESDKAQSNSNDSDDSDNESNNENESDSSDNSEDDKDN